MPASVQLILGLVILFMAGDFLVRGAVSLADRMKVSRVLIALTVVALCTSAPEMVITIRAAMLGLADIAVGNIIGSNISNILAVLGLTALVMPIAVESRIKKYDAWAMMALTILCFVLMIDGVLGRIEGMLMLAVFAAYLYREIRLVKKNPKEELGHELEDIPETLGLWPMIGALVVGTAGLAIGSEWLVEGASEIAIGFGVPEAVIGLTIVALGSSSPEIAASVMAARKGHADVALGNVVGSNIINLMVVLGLSAVVTHLPIGEIFMMRDLWLLLVATFILWLMSWKLERFTRMHGMLAFGCYLSYIAYLVVTMK